MKRIIILLLLGGIVSCLAAELRSLWVLPWDLQSAEEVDQVISDALLANQNELLLEVRYRADALYTPNRLNTDFANPEPRSYILSNDGFDPLAYAIPRAHEYGIKIQAWVIVFNATPLLQEYVSQNYIYKNHRDWITHAENGRQMQSTKQYGYFIDPGLPEVQTYLLDVFSDIVSGYPELDGLHLDYVRYPDETLGYHPISLQRFREQEQSISWNQWRRLQITEFVTKCRERIKRINPNILLTAAVFADINAATNLYAQDWYSWLQKGLIDRAYPMAYDLSYDVFANQIKNLKTRCNPRSIAIGIRAWAPQGKSLLPWDNSNYNMYDIQKRISLVRQSGFAGTALFSYSGLKADNGLDFLTAIAFFETPQLHAPALISRSQIGFPEISQTPPFTANKHAHFSPASSSDSLHAATPSQAKADFQVVFDQAQQMHVIRLQIPEEGRWYWEIRETGQPPLYSRYRYYFAGNNTDYWDGVLEDNSLIQEGEYIFSLQNSTHSYSTEIWIGSLQHE